VNVPGTNAHEGIHAGGCHPAIHENNLGWQLLASYEGGTLYYYHSDHLSVRVTTNANGNVMGEQGHYPYGEEWHMTNTTTKYVFTSYHRDDESGNDYAMHRYHVNRLGRFSTIDPLPRRGRNPQGLNRYSYAGNDPIGREDPSGMLDNLVCGPLGDCGGAGPSVGGDFGGDMAAGDPAVEVGGSGPGGNDFFGCDPSDPFRPCGGYCSDLEPECYRCDPGFSVCDCDPILGCEPSWPKVGWAHYLSLLALLNNLSRVGALSTCAGKAVETFGKCVAISIGVGQEPEACILACALSGPAWPECVASCLGIVEILEAVKVGLCLVAAIAVYEQCKGGPEPALVTSYSAMPCRPSVSLGTAIGP
jgi:RHS repeat-associated protein